MYRSVMGKFRILFGIAGAVMVLAVPLTLSTGLGVEAAAAPQTAHPTRIVGTPVRAAQSAVVNMAALARRDAARPPRSGPSMTRVVPAPLAPPEPGASALPFLPQFLLPAAGISPQVPSPSPALDFAGLDDIANLSPPGYRSIPPDTDGAVGLTKVMEGLNNNYRIFTKATGAVVSTVGLNTFWSAAGGSDFFDPKTIYDPINDRWIVVMMSDAESPNSSIEVGVSQTSDPSGSYYLFRFDADSTNLNWADFPTIGFNKDYVAVNMNMFTNSGGAYVSSKVLVLDYPSLRAGTSNSWWLTGSEYTASPAATYSATESTLYVAQHWNNAPGTYRVDTITKSGSAPLYTVGAVKSRGLSWTQPGGNILPQSAAGGIATQDPEIRSTPVVRDGFIYYTQTVGLPAGGLTRTSVLWTKLTASTGNVADGGLIDDPTATAGNGGKWYAYPHIAVNKFGDVIVGFSQFSSAQHASAGYAVHVAGDPPGTMRDPVVYKAGEDTYQKDYGSGRNRWGDYSKAQVDPSNDADLWVLNEYAKPVTGPGDQGGFWGTWWARVASPTAASFTISPSVVGGVGGHGTIAPATPQIVSSGATPTFTFLPASRYHVGAVTVDGGGVTMTSSNAYTFPAVMADHAISVAFAVNPKPTLGKPICPKSVKKGRLFKVYGKLSPRFAAGQKTVKLKAYRRVSGKWKLYKSYAAKNANWGSVTKYTAKIRITKKGTFRFKASTAATATWRAAKSGYSRRLTVK